MKQQCSSGIVGKRSNLRGSGDLPVCDGCCDSTLCQGKLCQDQDNDADRGLVCFKCDQLTTGANCTHFTECSRDETCFSAYTSGTHTLLTKLGCYSKSVCERVMARIGTAHFASSCWDCCDTDLCNTGCGTQTVSVSTRVPVTQKTTAATHCVDRTPSDMCKLAAAIVCQDKVHAQKANCTHYCGFC